MSEHEDKENHRPHLRRANMCGSMEDEIIAGLTRAGCCEQRGVWELNPLKLSPRFMLPSMSIVVVMLLLGEFFSHWCELWCVDL